jgi:hypothetical protein
LRAIFGDKRCFGGIVGVIWRFSVTFSAGRGIDIPGTEKTPPRVKAAKRQVEFASYA